MQGLISFFTSLGDTIVAVFQFWIKYISDLFFVVRLLGNLALSLPAMIGWLPSACISVTVLAFAIAVIYKIMGREG